MPIKLITTDAVAKPTTVYSHAAIADDVVYLAGQSPRDLRGVTVEPSDPHRQIRQVFENIAAVLKAAGCSFPQVMRMTVFIRRAEHIPIFWQVARDYLGEHRPTITVAIVEGLAGPDYLLEVETIAVKDKPNGRR